MGIKIKDGDEATKYLKSSGTGDDSTTNAYVPIHTLGSNSGVDIGDVDILSIAAGDNNIGNVDIASAIPAGGNNIGDVDVLSLPAIPAGGNNIGDVDIASIATNTNSIGKLGTANAGVDIGNVTSLLATDSLRNGTTAVTPAFAVINVASTGSAQEIVAGAGTDNKIRVLALNIVVGAAVNVYVASATSAITGAWEFNGKGDGIVLPFSPVGWFETAATQALNLFLSAGVSVDGSVTYVVVQ